MEEKSLTKSEPRKNQNLQNLKNQPKPQIQITPQTSQDSTQEEEEPYLPPQTQTPTSQLINKRQYYSSLIIRILSQTCSSTPYFLFPVTFTTISNKENLDLNSNDDIINFLAMGTSLYFFGVTAGFILSLLIEKLNIKIAQRILMLLFAFSLMLNITSDMSLILLSRFLQGCFGKVIETSSFDWGSEIALQNEKKSFKNMIVFLCSGTAIGMTFISAFDNGGRVFWRILYLIPTGIIIVAFILDLLIVKDLNSVRFLLEKNGFENSVKILKKVYSERTAKRICSEVETKTEEDYKKSKKENIWKKVKKNSAELKIVVWATFALSLTLFSVYSTCGILIASQDIKNETEIKLSKLSISLSFVFNLLANLITMRKNRNKNQRMSSLIGISIFLFCSILMVTAYHLEIYALAKISIVISGAGIAVAFSGFFPYCLKVTQKKFKKLSCIVVGFLSGFTTLIIPRMLGLETKKLVFVYFGFFVFHAIGLVITALKVKDLWGLSKNEIWLLLRGKY